MPVSFKNTLYAAFDLHPSAKGASTHIHYFSQALAEISEKVILASIGTEKMTDSDSYGNINTYRFNHVIPNYLHRAEEYAKWLKTTLLDKNEFELCHFRDIWSGLAILQEEKNYQTVFEVNGLPSIELPYRYPSIPKATLEKIKSIEKFCLEKSDKIVVPSSIIKTHLESKNIPSGKITVISNGAELQDSYEKPADAPEKYIIYFGAVQTWQGVDDLLRAYAAIRDYSDIKLVICSSTATKYTKPFRKFAEKLEIADNIIWKYQLPQSELYGYLQNALFSVAPLKDCSRNTEQGCSPLKIFEAMANKTSVIASDLPVVREIADEKSIRFFRSGRPAEIARAMRFMIEYPHLPQELSEHAYALINEKFLWKHKQDNLKKLYLQERVKNQ